MKHAFLKSVVFGLAAAVAGTGFAEVLQASAKVKPTEGNTASGTVYFKKVEEGVNVRAHFTGLTPGLHGFHIHEVGDCSAPDASSAGPHFNPHGMPHAGPEAEERHAGDLGNLEADEDGEAFCNFVDRHLELEGENSIIGRSVIVHADADDLTTQPTGNAGGRVGCGVIEAEAPAPVPPAEEPAAEQPAEEPAPAVDEPAEGTEPEAAQPAAVEDEHAGHAH